MNFYNAKMTRGTDFTDADFDELKSILETFGNVSWIMFYKQTNLITFETEGLRYLDRELFQKFLDKNSENEELVLEICDEPNFYAKYVIVNGEVLDNKLPESDYDKGLIED